MYLLPLPQPVNQSYGGGDVLEIRMLQEFCNSTMSNFQQVDSELSMMRLRHAELSALNTKLIQFMNWLAVTNPQILDEFQTTADTFEKLVPRNNGEDSGPQSFTA